jgi:hypothetical protein
MLETCTRPDTRWLDPAPFRSHVIHLMTTSGLTERELAALCRVSARLVRRLVVGRAGRPMRRIDPLSAGRLLAVSALEAGVVRTRQVPADNSRALLLTLFGRGRSAASLSRITGLAGGEVGELAAGRTELCPQLVELRLLAALAESDAAVAALHRSARHRPAPLESAPHEAALHESAPLEAAPLESAPLESAGRPESLRAAA